MSRAFFDGQGSTVSIGAELGKGGEGAVYDAPAPGKELVAKVYHEPMSSEKRAKLEAMVAVGDVYLRKISAWPSQLIFDRNRAPTGFLMPKISGHEPIHHVYSPAHRKQHFPKLTFKQLVGIARNTAAAFDAIHAHGHVIGDVNQGNLVTAMDCTVKLIDCDSFQISVNGITHRCEVGVPHFTPPELQKLTSFKHVTRTPNHDNFGLAVLIFHLLFMGRHPFSGRFLGKGDMPLEASIAQFKFAYGSDNAKRQMAAPPATPPLTLVPPNTAKMFETAFNENGASFRRPTAGEWVTALDTFAGSLVQCKTTPAHLYGSHQSQCPWCTIETTSNVQYFITAVAQAAFAAIAANANWKQIWAQIESLSVPGLQPHASTQPVAIPVPTPAAHKGAISRYHSFVAVIGFIAFIAGLRLPRLWLLWALCGVVATLALPTPTSGELAVRKQALESAKKIHSDSSGRYRLLSDLPSFDRKKIELSRIRDELASSGRRLESEKAKLVSTASARQLQRYLERYFISGATISGIGPARRATLASFGVETAADISLGKIQNIPGFGPSMTSQLLLWRRGLECRFVFDSAKSIDPTDIRAITNKINSEQTQLEGKLRTGLGELQTMLSTLQRDRAVAKQSLGVASFNLAQAEADLAAIRLR